MPDSQPQVADFPFEFITEDAAAQVEA